MPRGDGTGPNGMGPKTGRGVGYCSGFEMPGFANYGRGGFGRGMGGGRGFRWMSMPYEQTYDQKAVLKNQEAIFETQLKQVKERLKDLEEQK